MDVDLTFNDIAPSHPTKSFGPDHVQFGIPTPKQKKVEMLDPAEWEAFVEEWALSLRNSYFAVQRYAGSGDKGLDIIGFIKSNQIKDGFDAYQCKRYTNPLAPSDIWVELAKIVYYTWRGDYPVPRRYYFTAPKGVGTKLASLLSNESELKNELQENWQSYCQNNIVNEPVPLEGKLLSHLQQFDFSIFGSISTAKLVEGHATTAFHSVRFGGGLPRREEFEVPEKLQPEETRYTQQVYEAYSDNQKAKIDENNLASYPEFLSDLHIQRERFYSAESLRNFARDNVPPGTFESLQKEAFDAIYDTCLSNHPCGLSRMRAAMTQIGSVSFASNALLTRIMEPDKRGMCHQLANEDKIRWVAA